jgi:hypothetical protein
MHFVNRLTENNAVDVCELYHEELRGQRYPGWEIFVRIHHWPCQCVIPALSVSNKGLQGLRILN